MARVGDQGMSKVTSLKEDNFESGGETVVCWQVGLDDRPKPVPCYSGEAANLKIDEPLPSGWEVKTSKKGKDYLAVPKTGGGKRDFQAAYRNTKEGFEAEADSRLRWQDVEEERRDRRTALMQAIAAEDYPPAQPRDLATWLERADKFYEWLRSNVSERPTRPDPAGKVSDRVGPTSEEGKRGTLIGAAAQPSSEDPTGEARSDGSTAPAPTHIPVEPAPGAPGGASGRGSCLHQGGTRTVERAKGGSVEVCAECGAPMPTVTV